PTPAPHQPTLLPSTTLFRSIKYTITLIWYEKKLWGIFLLYTSALLLLLLATTSPLYAQDLRQIRGTVVDQKQQAVENASVKVKRSEEHTSELQSRENIVCRL